MGTRPRVVAVGPRARARPRTRPAAPRRGPGEPPEDGGGGRADASFGDAANSSFEDPPSSERVAGVLIGDPAAGKLAGVPGDPGDVSPLERTAVDASYVDSDDFLSGDEAPASAPAAAAAAAAAASSGGEFVSGTDTDGDAAATRPSSRANANERARRGVRLPSSSAEAEAEAEASPAPAPAVSAEDAPETRGFEPAAPRSPASMLNDAWETAMRQHELEEAAARARAAGGGGARIARILLGARSRSRVGLGLGFGGSRLGLGRGARARRCSRRSPRAGGRRTTAGSRPWTTAARSRSRRRRTRGTTRSSTSPSSRWGTRTLPRPGRGAPSPPAAAPRGRLGSGRRGRGVCAAVAAPGGARASEGSRAGPPRARAFARTPGIRREDVGVELGRGERTLFALGAVLPRRGAPSRRAPRLQRRRRRRRRSGRPRRPRRPRRRGGGCGGATLELELELELELGDVGASFGGFPRGGVFFVARGLVRGLPRREALGRGPRRSARGVRVRFGRGGARQPQDAAPARAEGRVHAQTPRRVRDDDVGGGERRRAR